MNLRLLQASPCRLMVAIRQDKTMFFVGGVFNPDKSCGIMQNIIRAFDIDLDTIQKKLELQGFLPTSGVC